MNGSSIPGLGNLEPQETVEESAETCNASFGNLETTNAANDLQKLLVELSQYSSQPNQQNEEQQQSNQVAQVRYDFSTLQQLEQLPVQRHQAVRWQQSAPIAQITNVHRIVDPRLNTQLQQATTPPAQLPRTPPIDPATILEWPQALRCINKISAHNPHLAATVKGVSFDCLYAV
jgi:hypothetical protein